jgi:hypothetical protein
MSKGLIHHSHGHVLLIREVTMMACWMMELHCAAGQCHPSAAWNDESPTDKIKLQAIQLYVFSFWGLHSSVTLG